MRNLATEGYFPKRFGESPSRRCVHVLISQFAPLFFSFPKSLAYAPSSSLAGQGIHKQTRKFEVRANRKNPPTSVTRPRRGDVLVVRPRRGDGLGGTGEATAVAVSHRTVLAWMELVQHHNIYLRRGSQRLWFSPPLRHWSRLMIFGRATKWLVYISILVAPFL